MPSPLPQTHLKKWLTFISLLLLTLPSKAQYTINSVFSTVANCDTMTRGIYIIWWDKNFADYSADADEMLDSMLTYRSACLTELGMQDPPNPKDGHFYNVYLHQPSDLFPSGWGNGQGTDSNGYPFLTLPIGAHIDWVNLGHETFHVFQYSANSPGFAYSGDSQWYIEASANWFAAIRNKTFNGNFLEGESLVRLPHVPLWLSFDNFPASYPQNWQRYVHQYAMSLFLLYLTEEAGVSDSFVCAGFYSGTNELPQEYLYNAIGPTAFRDHFMNWAAHMTNHFDYILPAQSARAEVEWHDYADPADDNEFTETYTDTGSGGWYRPHDTLATTGWSFNTYKVRNSGENSYTFELNADVFGNEGGIAYFQGKTVVMNSATGTRFYDLNMVNQREGSLSVNVTPTDTAICFIIGSMPEIFRSATQFFSYEMKIEKGAPLSVEDFPSGLFEIRLIDNVLSVESISGDLLNLKVFNIQGQTLFEKSFRKKTEANLSSLPSGNYFVRIISREGSKTKRIFVR